MHQAKKNTTFARKVMTRSVWSALLVMGLAAGMATQAQMAYAQDSASATARKAYSVPAGPLGNALTDFASQAGVTIQIDSSVLEGRRSAGLNGNFSVQEGFARLLSGSGMDAIERSRNIYVLRNAQAESTLPAVTVMAAAVNTTSEGTGSYGARGTSIGKGDQKLKDIPQSVSVVTRQRLDDQALVTLSDVLDNVTGITTLQTPAGGKSFAARGFNLNTIQYDGIPLSRQRYSSASHYSANTVFLDRVEVLRGAQGLLEGAGTPGGAVNLVRKRGTTERAITFNAKAGSWDHYGSQLDVGGPLNEEGTLRGRAVVDYETQHSFIDVKKDNTRNLYAALDYDISRDTTIGIGVAQTKIRATPFFWGHPRYSDGTALPLPRSTFLGASWNRWDQDETTIYADLEHRFNADWKLKAAAIHVKEEIYQKYMVSFGAVNPVTLTGPGARAFEADIVSRHTGLDVNLQGRFNALGLEHNLTVGANASRLESETAQKNFIMGLPVNVFNPNHNLPEPTNAQMGTATLSGYDPISQKGLYGVLRTKITEPLTLIMGGRFSWYDYAYRSGNSITEAKEDGKFTPYAGIVYALTPQWSAYASYTDIFNPQSAVDANQTILKPEMGSNYEAGIKGELFDGRLNASFAVFRLNQMNRAVQDLDSGMICSGGTDYCSRASGKVRSQGIEMEVSGEITPSWKLAAGYTYQNLKFIEDIQFEGRRFNAEIPKQIFRLWSDYTLPGEWNRVNIGGGVNVQSAIQSANYLQSQGGYSVWNARVGYRINKTWSAALNVNNLFDKTYYTRIFGPNTYGNYYGTPRSALLSVQGKF